ncbi:MAG TPA: deoxyribodipyrimidine photo-lyase [Dongiaceae bacterium]|nr:deoxyribodipyrimidine photo-lyase [Dongiaceae bacterium]
MEPDRPILLWLRRDLRLKDNPALAAAAETGRPIVPVFLRPEQDATGGAASWWRGRSLAALARSLAALGSRLVLRTGAAEQVLPTLARETGASALAFNHSHEPAQIAADQAVMRAWRDGGIEVIERRANRLHDPWAVKTGTGGPFKVFTPFWRKLSADYRPPAPLRAPKAIRAPRAWPESEDIADWQVTAAWASGFGGEWTPGEAGAEARLKTLVRTAKDYSEERDRPDREGTSRLSPHLAWGETSVHEIWRRLEDGLGAAAEPFLRQLGWRDFNSHLLYHFPELPTRPWNAAFARFPFAKDAKGLKAWQRGLTGYPIVDAGMRQLWATGWMHNRVRMIAASFLIKDQMIDWRQGEAWFWDTLVDADLAQNAGNWQWVAGSGADAAPYFRIFNPVSQSRKFDPEGAYIRRWVPELARLEGDALHAPWAATPLDLAAAGVVLGRDYPAPVVDHAEARERALAAYQRIK